MNSMRMQKIDLVIIDGTTPTMNESLTFQRTISVIDWMTFPSFHAHIAKI